MENILIVESHNDKFFIERLLKHINQNNANAAVVADVCKIDDFECMDGLDKDKLVQSLKYQITKAQRGYVDRIGILIDQDNKTNDERLQLVNEALIEAFPFAQNQLLLAVAQMQTFRVTHSTTVEVACFFTNVNGSGELETVLKNIKSIDSPYADCLQSWRDCLQNRGVTITNKDFDKRWIDFYIRYDTCLGEERFRAHKNCNMQIALEEKNIWDLNHNSLDALKNFLQLFT